MRRPRFKVFLKKMLFGEDLGFLFQQHLVVAAHYGTPVRARWCSVRKRKSWAFERRTSEAADQLSSPAGAVGLRAAQESYRNTCYGSTV